MLEAPATLATLCTDLGPEIVELAIAPGGVEVEVHDVALHDPCDAPARGVKAGDVVLAVGAVPDAEGTAELLAAAGAADAAAVVVAKRDGELPRAMLAAAEEAGVAILAVGPDVRWGHLYTLLQTAIDVDASSELPRVSDTALPDLFALADATAALAGGPITIEDTRGQVLAFSHGGQEVDEARRATILARRVPDHLMQVLQSSGVLERVLADDGPVPFEYPESAPRRAIAIRAGARVLGMIWLVGNGSEPTAQVDDALREAARIAALHLIRERVKDDLDRRSRGSMLQALLRGGGPLASTLERLGLGGATGFVVLAVQVQAGADMALVNERLVDIVAMHLQSYRRKAAATALDGRVYALASCAGDDDREALRRTLQDCLDRARSSLRVELRASLGERVASGEGIGAARDTADRGVDFAREDNRVIRFEEVQDRALLADVAAYVAEHRFAVSRELQTLLDYDRRHPSDYVGTLRAFLDCCGDAGAAAGRMQVHVNTLRYRLRRIAEMTGLDIGDPDTRFAVELQLRALRPRRG